MKCKLTLVFSKKPNILYCYCTNILLLRMFSSVTLKFYLGLCLLFLYKGLTFSELDKYGLVVLFLSLPFKFFLIFLHPLHFPPNFVIWKILHLWENWNEDLYTLHLGLSSVNILLHLFYISLIHFFFLKRFKVSFRQCNTSHLNT